ncbi:MAG: tetratricopeptide repeat protein [Lentisphaerae bacterium]|nr:tetratricopeptide repeat protein [Lentisphaerota bacterium]
MAVADDGAAELMQARAALDDELYNLARAGSVRLLARPDVGADFRLQAVLLLARALYGEGRHKDAVDLLRPWNDHVRNGPHAAELTFWLAAAEFKAGLSESGLARMTDFERDYPNSPYLPAALRLRAWICLELGRVEEAVALFAGFDGQVARLFEPVDRLEWGKALIQAGAESAARDVLQELVRAHPAERVGREAAILLARIILDEGQTTAARELLQSVIDQPETPAALRGAACMALSSVATTETNLVEAITLLDQSLQLLDDPLLKGEANLRKGALLLRLGRTEEGAALVRSFVVAAPPPTAAAVQLQLARTLQGLGLHEMALNELQHYVETFSDPVGLAQAWLDRGWSLVHLSRYIEAAAAFEKSAELTRQPDHRVELWQKIGDCLFAAEQYREARQAYAQVIEMAPDTAVAEQALLQSAVAHLRQGLAEEAQEILWQLIDRAGNPAMEAQAWLQLAELLSGRGRGAAARRIYRMLQAEAPEDERVFAMYQAGLLEYRLGHFDTALEQFNRLARNHADRAEAQLAGYMSGWCHYMLQDDRAAIAAFENFARQYPRSPQSPEALFWLAEYEFNRGAYYLAETGFVQLTMNYPDAPLAASALYWAGRAALMQKEFRRANEKRADARFFQGEALCEMGEFAGAIMIFDEIIRQNPAGYLAQQARFRKGDSQFTLGSDDPRRYEEAVASYRVIIDRADVSPADRLQAEYKIGRCLEKLDRRLEAMEYYMNVVYTFPRLAEGRFLNTVWFTRAAFNAAAMMEEDGSWRKAVGIYQRVVDSGVAAARDAQERIRKIRLEQWMLFY